jgi:hypothetical protein
MPVSVIISEIRRFLIAQDIYIVALCNHADAEPLPLAKGRLSAIELLDFVKVETHILKQMLGSIRRPISQHITKSVLHRTSINIVA